MSNSANLGMPFLQPAQAQKHVTVNEALVLADAAARLVLASVEVINPPASAGDGTCYGIGSGATGAWAGQDGLIAVADNGGWVFLTPVAGWQAWVADQSVRAIFDGAAWRVGAMALAPGGAATLHEIVEIDHALAVGTTSTATAAIPAMSIVFGVTGLVTTAITGTLTTFRVGVSGSDNRYGSGYGIAQDSWLRGLTGQPQAYYSDTDLILTGESGDFAGGTVKLCVHLMRLDVPLP